MNEIDPRSAERAFYDDTDYADVDLELADDVHVVRQPEPRSTFALRLDGSTIEQIRDLAYRRGTRPTQLAREWLVERLEQEQRERSAAEAGRPPNQHIGDVDESYARQGRLEDRVARLERAFVYLTGSYARGTRWSPSKDADLVAELEVQAQVARELRQQLDTTATVEALPDTSADLIVRRGEQAWVVEIKGGGAVDLIPAFQRLVTLAAQMDAKAVLVSPQLPIDEAEALSNSSGVFVTRADELDGLLAEISSHSSAPGKQEDASLADADSSSFIAAGSARTVHAPEMLEVSPGAVAGSGPLAGGGAMLKNPPVHTIPHGDGWANRREGSSRVAKTFTRKADAQAAGKRTAQRERTEHIIHNKDGEVGSRNSYDNDPFPPRADTSIGGS